MSDKSTATVVGEIIQIDETQQITDSFQKRTFAVETGGEYSQQIGVECVQKDCALLDGFSVGQQVTATCNVRGRKWNEKYYTNLQAWRLETTQSQEQPSAPSEQPHGDNLEGVEGPSEQALPF